jgi:hypothetical protein
MTFARWLFRIAGIYGLLVLTPIYFMESRIGQDSPLEITHPEYFYGFVGVGLAWQVAFLVIGQGPVRYRLMMIPAIVEKATFAAAAAVLYAQQRIPGPVFAAGMVDLTWGVLFAVAFWRTRGRYAASGGTGSSR